MPKALRENPFLKDYLFEKYFRFNTFGVFIDHRVFRAEFIKVPDYMKILKTVKPTYKNFIVFERDIEVFDKAWKATMEQVVFKLGWHINEYIYFDKGMGMALELEDPVVLGTAFESIRHSYDIMYLSLGFRASPEVIKFFPFMEPIMGWDILVGMDPLEGVFDAVGFNMYWDILPPESMFSLTDSTLLELSLTNLILYYMYAEPSGLDLNDSSGYENDGLIEGLAPVEPLLHYTYEEPNGLLLNSWTASFPEPHADIEPCSSSPNCVLYYPYTEPTGEDLFDLSEYGNDGFIEDADSGIEGPVVWYTYSEGSGSTLNDSSGYGNTVLIN
jgi:hypothetical protein